jgi:rhodanese-related sulfurtransferase
MLGKITGQELKRRIDNREDLVILEALPFKYYRKAHIPGAIHFAPEDPKAFAEKALPDKNAQIIVYCADSSCGNSEEAGRRLLELGYRNVFEYSEGKAGWIGLGYPVSRGSSPAGEGIAA